MQIHLRFANFYHYFVKYYAKIIRLSIELLKNNEEEKQNKILSFDIFAIAAIRIFTNISTIVFILIYLNSINQNIVKIDTSKFAIAVIFL